MNKINSISETAPNGYFVRDLIVYGSLRQGGAVAKGFVFEPPDLANAATSELNGFQDQLSLLLASLGDHQRLQVQWYCDSDYRKELLRYHDETQNAANIWTRRVRNERFTRYWTAMTERRLRRQRLVLWISRKIDSSPSSILSRATLTEARVVIEDWRWKYNNIRPHRSLGYITPLKFAEKQIQQTEQNNTSEQCIGYARAMPSLRRSIDFLYNKKHTIYAKRLTKALAQFE